MFFLNALNSQYKKKCVMRIQILIANKSHKEQYKLQNYLIFFEKMVYTI